MAKKLNLKELLAQQKEIADQIKDLPEIERTEFKKRVELEAEELGLNCYEIWGAVKRSYARPGKAPKERNAPKYIDPASPNNVYCLTRGKKPRWLQTYLDGGRTLEEFAA